MFETMITISVMIISIITTFFHHAPTIQGSNQPTMLVAIDIVGIQGNNVPKKKKATRAVTQVKKRSVVKPELRKQKNKVSGFQDETYVYGEVKPLKNDRVQGFIYHPDNGKTYVYGKKVKNKLILYDSNGNLYQMIHKEPHEH